MMELTEDFMKLIQIAIIIVGVLAIFFTFIQYNILVTEDKAEREAITFGNYLLKSGCLTYDNTKSLFYEEKLDTIDQSCFNYHHGAVTIELLDGSKSWYYEITSPVLGGDFDFIVSVVMNDASKSIKPALMKVEL